MTGRVQRGPILADVWRSWCGGAHERISVRRKATVRKALAMTRRIPLLVTPCLLIFANANAFAGSITGDVFATMRSGDVRRAADLDVLIVSATSEFEGEWERLQSEYEERVKPVVAEHESIKAQARISARQPERGLGIGESSSRTSNRSAVDRALTTGLASRARPMGSATARVH
jgi:hypothetical protein